MWFKKNSKNKTLELEFYKLEFCEGLDNLIIEIKYVKCSVQSERLLCFALFFPVELEFYRLEFHWNFFFFALFCSALLCSVLKPFIGNFFLFIFFLDMQGAQKLKCVHAQNVIHKHSLTGKEAENVNALKLRQHAFLIGTKL